MKLLTSEKVRTICLIFLLFCCTQIVSAQDKEEKETPQFIAVKSQHVSTDLTKAEIKLSYDLRFCFACSENDALKVKTAFAEFKINHIIGLIDVTQGYKIELVVDGDTPEAHVEADSFINTLASAFGHKGPIAILRDNQKLFDLILAHPDIKEINGRKVTAIEGNDIYFMAREGDEQILEKLIPADKGLASGDLLEKSGVKIIRIEKGGAFTWPETIETLTKALK